jgi:hypothetical protein
MSRGYFPPPKAKLDPYLDSPPRDAALFAERCGTLRREMRHSPPRDAGVFVTRCGSLRREMRESWSRDAVLSATRCGSLCREMRHSPRRFPAHYAAIGDRVRAYASPLAVPCYYGGAGPFVAAL